MRPEILFPLFKPVSTLPGIGPRMEKLVEKAAGANVIDLLWHLPTHIIDRSKRPLISEVVAGELVTLNLRVNKHIPSPRRGLPYRVLCSDDTGLMTLVFFHAHSDYLVKTLPEDGDVVVSGRIEIFNDQIQMSHPDYIVLASEQEKLPLIEPAYRLTAGLSQKVLHKAINAALDLLPDLPEWNDVPLLKQHQWPSWQDALKTMHSPTSVADANEESPARRRLAYDELLAHQFALRLMRAKTIKQMGRSINSDGGIKAKVLSAFPYELTNSQKTATAEIEADMAQPERMLRMLQGDVGSGKTLVALLAMVRAVEAGLQAAMMAPTEILARQHYASIEPLARDAGLTIEILTGRDKGKSRVALLERLQSGEIDLIVGTHALFQEDVHFKDLGLAIIDEQHRFGVGQRLALSDKGPERADILVMTATPIPRTLSMAYYGDMEISLLTEKPPGRQPIKTTAMPVGRLEDVVQAVGRALKNDDRAYWVCPLVEESDLLDVAAAEDRFAHLKSVFGEQVGLIHGRMKPKEKDEVMERFQSGSVSILVATTVIEVGVDVPEATIMIIEHAERFGLAQLHQLRGRVGRGTKPSSCVLLYQGPLGETSRARIEIMRETDDGFRIADEDLRLRGPGDLLGVRQSGLPDFKVADLMHHQDLLAIAHKDATMLCDQDQDLKSPRGQAIRTLLYLFEKDEAIRFLRS